MNIDDENFENWMARIMKRFDDLCKLLGDVAKDRPVINGEKLLDNSDLCNLLNVSKRTLQRYRSLGELPFQMIYHKTYYKESDVLQFIRDHFNKSRGGGGFSDDKTGI
jgi:hypothetical protein